MNDLVRSVPSDSCLILNLIALSFFHVYILTEARAHNILSARAESSFHILTVELQLLHTETSESQLVRSVFICSQFDTGMHLPPKFPAPVACSSNENMPLGDYTMPSFPRGSLPIRYNGHNPRIQLRTECLVFRRAGSAFLRVSKRIVRITQDV